METEIVSESGSDTLTEDELGVSENFEANGSDPTARADVCVMGAGIIGLHNALQYAARGHSVIIVDELTDKAKSRMKVGESLLGYSNAFLRTVGDFQQEVSQSFEKKGVWFIYGLEGKSKIDDSIYEFGVQNRLPERWQAKIGDQLLAKTIFGDAQIVRPEFEAAMRARIAEDDRITFLDVGLAVDVTLDEGDGDHCVSWRSRDSKRSGTIDARWVIDCTGRRRLLASKFGHSIDLDDGFSTAAAWAQFENCPSGMFGDDWLFQFPDGETIRRDLNTVHLWGRGYWIWLIRLNGDRLSVGVSYDRLDPPAPGGTKEVFWDIVRRYSMLDFLKEEHVIQFASISDVQHISDTYISPDRYVMVGDAASIIDAYYSQGMSLALATSWHAANIASEELQTSHLDEKYLDQVNRATLADWKLMRGTVRGKYGGAIADSRFFILDHMLDYILLGAGLTGRYQIATWLYKTHGARDAETPQLAKTKAELSRRMYLSQSIPMGWFSPETVVKVVERQRRQIEKRALWRLQNGIKLQPTASIMRSDAPFPPLLKLPGQRVGRERFSLTPKVVQEPAMMRPNITKKLPIVFRIVGVIAVSLAAFGIAFDVIDTRLRKLRLRKRSEKPDQSTAVVGS